MQTRLTDEEIRKELEQLAGWHKKENAIERIFEFPDFLNSMRFVNRIAGEAEQAQHHPDFAISYNRVSLSLTSHDSGGVTESDVKMAHRINEIAGP